MLVFSFGSPTSGVPCEWAATEDRPGVNLLADLSNQTASRIAEQMRRSKQTGDVTVASIHWGGNWGYDIPDEQIDFAHRLIDEGVGVVYGHSSHHVKALEVYRDRLILYGCGDLLNDYEGIGGYEAYRADLGLMYFAAVEPGTGRLREAGLVPVQVRRFSLRRPSPADAQWLCELLNRQGKPFATTVRSNPDNSMALKWTPRVIRATSGLLCGDGLKNAGDLLDIPAAAPGTGRLGPPAMLGQAHLPCESAPACLALVFISRHG